MNLKKIIGLILLVWLFTTILGGLSLRAALPGKSESGVTSTNENTFRAAFFADSHIVNKQEGTEVDFGGPVYEIPGEAKIALRKCNPDAIFGLGDLTAHTTPPEWVGYKNWIDNFEAPVYDLLGNHDKDHLWGVGTCGTGYFTEVERVSDTKVLKIGNNVFILVSEEHNPEGNGDDLMSTIPDKRFDFVENQLKKYSENYNIFIMNHTPLSGTVAFSKTWFYGTNPNWLHITDKFMDLLYEYENSVDAHVSGHIHTDYRMRDEPYDQDLNQGVENVGKFVSGSKINKSDRKYEPDNLPEIYFLNMPIVDIDHNWFAARFAFLGKLVEHLNLNPASRKTSPDFQRSRVERGRKGLPLMGMLHTPKNSYFTGRGAVYYFDMENGENSVNIITRWVGGNKDMENYPMRLSNPISLGDGEMEFVASDLSLRKRDNNLEVTLDNWFKIRPGTTGLGEFSKAFYQENKIIKGLTIENYDLKDYSAEWQGSTDYGDNWDETWYQNPENMGKVNAVKIKIRFTAKNTRPAFIEDIKIRSSSE